MLRNYGTNSCRLCLEKKDDMMDIFSGSNRNSVVPAQVISELLHVVVSKDDIYPKVVCKECHTKLMGYYRAKNKFPIDTFPGFVLFRNQCEIVKSAVDYTERYNVATPDYQHSPISWDHSPLSLELEELVEEEELQTRRDAVDNLLDLVAKTLKNIRGGERLSEEHAKIEEMSKEDDVSSDEISVGNDDMLFSPLHMAGANSDGPSDGTTSSSSPPVQYCSRGILRNRERKGQRAKGSLHFGRCEFKRLVKVEDDSSEESSDSSETDSSSYRPSNTETDSTEDDCHTYQCSQCDNMYDRIVDLNRHVTRVHMKIMSDGESSSSPVFRRKKRRKHLKRVEIWDKFVVEVDGKEWIRCFACGVRFPCLVELQSHILNPTKKGGRKGDCENDRKTFKCCCCPLSFEWLVMLERHVKTQHSEERPHVCKKCGISFKLKKYLQKHVKLHTFKKTFKCKECGKMFSTQTLLNIHSDVHVTEELFECGDCGKKFRTKRLLTAHLRIHDPARHIKCPNCPRRYVQMSDLRKHMVLHTGARNFECGECHKTFLYKRNLNQHMRLHRRLKVAM